ncbi:MAG: hypothetical protein WHS89_08005 [Acidimicrobiales bacterium]
MDGEETGLDALRKALETDPELARRLDVDPASVVRAFALTDEDLAILERHQRRADGPRLADLFTITDTPDVEEEP